MIIIANYDKKQKKFLPQLNLAENEEQIKKAIKKQLLIQIVEDKQSISAYKNLEIYKIGKTDEELNIETSEKQLILTYSDMLYQIIEDIGEKLKGE